MSSLHYCYYQQPIYNIVVKSDDDDDDTDDEEENFLQAVERNLKMDENYQMSMILILVLLFFLLRK